MAGDVKDPDGQAPPPGDGDERPDALEFGDYAIEGDEQERAAPRRAASAEFVVQSQAGGQAALREALDPAHQSLTDALRLSYRVLQAVMVILIVLFAFSGIETIDEGESGVMLRWGKIQAVDGREALSPGIHFSIWPYPAGEYVIFRDKGRAADVDTAFWPGIRSGRDIEDMIDEQSSGGVTLKPGRDGYLLTRDFDIGHLQLAAEYRIDGVGAFVSHVNDADPARDADRLVELALKRAAVHTTAGMSLKELVEIDDATRAEIRRFAQDLLDGLDAGIFIEDIRTPDSKAALAIESQYRAAQNARIDADKAVQQARQSAEETLIDMAGENWTEVLALIDAYDAATASADETTAAARLDEIRAWLDSDRIGGGIASIVREAEAYESMVELTLGSDLQLFQGLLDAYRKNPQLTVTSLWMEAYAAALRAPDAEVIYVPSDSGTLVLRIQGSSAVQDVRTSRRLEAREREQLSGGFGSFIQQRGDVRVDGPGRRLNVTEGGIAPGGGG